MADLFLGADELVAGRDNKHMDFRLSIRKVRDDSGLSVVVSTLCIVHNAFGRFYLAAVISFHTFGLRNLMARAVDARASLATFVPDPCRPVDVAARQVSRLLAHLIPRPLLQLLHLLQLAHARECLA